MPSRSAPWLSRFCFIFLLFIVTLLFILQPLPLRAAPAYRIKALYYWDRDTIPYVIVVRHGGCIGPLVNVWYKKDIGALYKAVEHGVEAWNRAAPHLYQFYQVNQRKNTQVPLTIYITYFDNQLAALNQNVPRSDVAVDENGWKPMDFSRIYLNVLAVKNLTEEELQGVVVHELLHTLMLDDRYKAHGKYTPDDSSDEDSVMTNDVESIADTGEQHPLFSTPQLDDILGVTRIWNYYKRHHIPSS